MNLFLLGLTCSEWPAQALRLQNASSCLHYPGACIITTLSATHRPCYPAASQYLHKEPQVLRLRCPVPVFRHHAMSRPLQSQRSRHISCLTASLLPCVFLIGTAHNNTALRSVSCYVLSSFYQSLLCLRAPANRRCQTPCNAFFHQRHPQFVVACRLTRHV